MWKWEHTNKSPFLKKNIILIFQWINTFNLQVDDRFLFLRALLPWEAWLGEGMLQTEEQTVELQEEQTLFFTALLCYRPFAPLENFHWLQKENFHI